MKGRMRVIAEQTHHMETFRDIAEAFVAKRSSENGCRVADAVRVLVHGGIPVRVSLKGEARQKVDVVNIVQQGAAAGDFEHPIVL